MGEKGKPLKKKKDAPKVQHGAVSVKPGATAAPAAASPKKS